jgi:hypothetical protein
MKGRAPFGGDDVRDKRRPGCLDDVNGEPFVNPQAEIAQPDQEQ